MRRTRAISVLCGALLAALLLPSAALAGPAPAPAGPAPAPAIVVEPPIELGCALVLPAPVGTAPRIVCRWSALDGVDVAEYRVWRRVDGGPARLIARVGPTEPLRHADFAIRAGHTYTYRIVARAADGTRLGVSAPVAVRFGRLPEVLRFDCFYKVDAAVAGVFCRWSAATRPAAVRYVLFRSVDGGAREAIYRAPLDGRRAYLDTDVASGQRIRYAVVAFAADGRVVGISRVDAVLVP